MEKNLYDSQKILEYIGEGLLYADREGRILFFNKAAENLTGWSISECIGSKIDDIFCLKDYTTKTYLNDYYYEIMENGVENGLIKDTVLIKKDKSAIYVSAKISPVRNEENEITGIVIVFRDISRLKSIEDSLNIEHKNLKTIFETASVGMLVVDERLMIKEINKAMLFIIGKKYESSIEKRLGEGIGCAKSIIAGGCGLSEKCRNCDMRENLTKIIETDEECIGLEIKFEVISENETVFKWLKVNMTKLFLEEHKNYLLIVNDISENKKLVEDLIKEKDNAEAANKAKSQFLANMSHEIRTPLNGIVGMIDLTLIGELKDEQKDNLETAKTCVDSLLKVINDILDFSKIEAGKMKIIKSSFRLADLVEKTIKPYKIKAKENYIEVDYFISSELPQYIIGDQGRLKQILNNLLNNALKFTDDGSIRLNVDLKKEDNDEYILFEVSDTGLGIAEEELHKLFKSFSQVDGSYTRKYNGTGLGLVISKQLVEKMSGSIWVNSQKDKGSTFSFTIKLERGNHENITEKKKGKMLFAARKLNILLVDDDKINQTVIERMLNEFGHSVTIANNGIEALKAVFNNNFDMVLMDIQMPEMDGIEVTKYIREQETNQKLRLPIVALTAHAIQGDKERFLACGMDAYVPKPVVMSEFFQTMEEIIKEKDTSELANLIESSKKSTTSKENVDKSYLIDLIFKLKRALNDNNISLLEKYSHLIREYAERFGMEEVRQNAFKIELNARKNKLIGINYYIENIENNNGSGREMFL